MQEPVNILEVGSFQAVIDRITTTKDGGAKVAFEVGANDIDIINKLMTIHAEGQALLQLGVIRVE